MEENKLNGKEDEQIRYLSKVFFGISNIKRFKIVLELIIKEKNVRDLTNILDMPQSIISKNLKILIDNNILNYRKSGREVYYSIDEEFKSSYI